MVVSLRDSHMYDVHDDFKVSEAFDESPMVYAAMSALTLPGETTNGVIYDQSLSSGESIGSGRQGSGYQPRRRRYMFATPRVADSPSSSIRNVSPTLSPQSQSRELYSSDLERLGSRLLRSSQTTAAQSSEDGYAAEVVLPAFAEAGSEDPAHIEPLEQALPAPASLRMQLSAENMECDVDHAPRQLALPNTEPSAVVAAVVASEDTAPSAVSAAAVLEDTASTAVAASDAQSPEPTFDELPQIASSNTTVTSTPVVSAATIAAAAEPASKDEEAPATKEYRPNAYLHSAYPALMKRLSYSPGRSIQVAKEAQSSAPAVPDSKRAAGPPPAQAEAPLDTKPSLKPEKEPLAAVAESVISLSSRATPEVLEVVDSSSSEEEDSDESESSSEDSDESESSSDEEDDVTQDLTKNATGTKVGEVAAPKAATNVLRVSPVVRVSPKGLQGGIDTSKTVAAGSLAKAASVN
ncbi:hypothetical protein GGI06_003587 [Coemansia sp. S85]|nr:hypothetical protein GGI06_003587 [Coemansia sp. S85]